jgi:subtilase family serine protease
VLAGLLALVLSSGSSTPATAGGSAHATVVRGVALPPHSRLIGPTPPRTEVQFSLVLRLRQSRISRFLAGLYDPSSASYHHFIGAQAFGRRFGISDAQLYELVGSLRRAGITVTHRFPQRTAVDVMAPAAAVDRFLGLHLLDYRTAGGRRFHSPGRAVSVPLRLRTMVAGVAGLNGASVPRADDVPANGVDPTVASQAYDIAPLYSQGIRGQGEKVAVIENSQFDQYDLDQFTQQFHLPPFAPQNIPTPQDGGAVDQSADGEGETELDVELIHEVAPQAQILDYNAPDYNPAGLDSLGDIIDNIVASGQTDVVSDSAGFCELDAPSADIQRDEQAIEAAVAHGISIFKSSGDAGAYQCGRSNPSDHRLSVEWPTSSPGVVAVGGTALSVTATGGYSGETAWEDVLQNQGGGGGLSTVFRRPPWQQAPGVINQYSNGMREVPDVSANADPNTGWALFTDGSLGRVAGTSAAAPFWAGAMALIEQYAHAHGVAHLGFVDPMLYTLGSTPQPAPPFHDVTIGTNRYYPATTGWDFATGLGSPDVYNLAQDVVRYLKSHPAGR